MLEELRATLDNAPARALLGAGLAEVSPLQGDAIPAEAQPGLFEPSRRAVREEGSNASGLGLGLFIARQIALAHGGKVEVRPVPGGGTTFTVRLPRSATEA